MPKKPSWAISGKGRSAPRYPKDSKARLNGGSANNRNTAIDDTSFRNTSPGVPNSPEAVNLMFKGRIPMSNRLTNLVLDEQQFLSKEELVERLDESMAELKPAELAFAHGILGGNTAAQSYLDAGYMKAAKRAAKTTDEKTKVREDARKEAAKLRKKDGVATYISAVLRLNHLKAMEEVGFTHVEWLKKQRDVLEMSLGEKKIKKTFIIEGKTVETEVEDACLGVANKSLETLAKHYGWLNEKLHIEGAGLGPTVVLKDYSGAKPEEPETEDNETGDGETE